MDQKPIYEGKAKKIFATDNPHEVLVYFKDDATAFNNEKKGAIDGKGAVNATMSALIYQVLDKAGIANHFLSVVSERELLVRRVEIVLVEVIVRNITAGSICRRLGIQENRKLDPPLVEFCYKNDDYGDPVITEDHIRIMELATPAEVTQMGEQALKINTILTETFAKINLTLVDFKLEFGRDPERGLILADEISPDTCRLWDAQTGRVLDKDRFRHDMGDVKEAYLEVLDRVSGGVS